MLYTKPDRLALGPPSGLEIDRKVADAPELGLSAVAGERRAGLPPHPSFQRHPLVSGLSPRTNLLETFFFEGRGRSDCPADE